MHAATPSLVKMEAIPTTHQDGASWHIKADGPVPLTTLVGESPVDITHTFPAFPPLPARGDRQQGDAAVPIYGFGTWQPEVLRTTQPIVDSKVAEEYEKVDAEHREHESRFLVGEVKCTRQVEEYLMLGLLPSTGTAHTKRPEDLLCSWSFHKWVLAKRHNRREDEHVQRQTAAWNRIADAAVFGSC